jgi:glycosyltransferase involved in cell wall biosynthesis
MSNLIEGRDFLIVGQQPWDVPIGSNCKNIAEEISKHNRVLYINIPLDRNTILRNAPEDAAIIAKRKKVLERKAPALEQVSNNLWTLTPNTVLESINFLPDGLLFDFFNKRNNKRMAKEIRKGLSELGFKDFLLFNDSDMFRSFYLKELLKPAAYIYYSRDNLISTDYFKKHGVRLEPKLMAKADACVANSPFLRDCCAAHNAHSFYVGQGCDLSIFDAQQSFDEPDEFKGIGHPRIGYIGALLALRLDIPLLESLAAAQPEWQWLLVGPEDAAFKASKLHQLSNVHFTGPKKPEVLAQYLNAFDVAINPQVINDMTIGNYPRKIDEYLAMGKPTVATRTPAMSIFEAHTFLAEGKEEYHQAISEALETNSEALEKTRIAFAHSHTWENSVDAIYGALRTIGKIA